MFVRPELYMSLLGLFLVIANVAAQVTIEGTSNPGCYSYCSKPGEIHARALQAFTPDRGV